MHAAPFSAAAGGILAFQTGSPETELILVDGAGKPTRTVGAPERFGNPKISPDGKRIAFEIFSDSPERLVWVQDVDRGVRTPISFRGTMADSAAFSPDGESVYFDSNHGGKWEVYRKAVNGGGEPENLGAPPGEDLAVLDVSRDGRWLLASSLAGELKYDLYLRALGASRETWIPWSSGPFVEDRGAFSPDSRWVAYTSDAAGRMEVYLAPLEGGPKVRNWQISSGGGFEPRFSADGRTIHYRSPSSEWMAVDVDLSGESVRAGSPRVLFPIPVVELPYLRNLMDVLPDGSGFLTVRPVHDNRAAVRVRAGRN
jgi:Tol biopolymer transport system component